MVRDGATTSLAAIETEITDFGRCARDDALKIEELQGGTFTVTNGGVFGSLMSTPILNAPQSGILGMHKIQPRPIVTRRQDRGPAEMMYLALTYDHRTIVDGREAVTFLVRVKECLEDPARLVLDFCVDYRQCRRSQSSTGSGFGSSFRRSSAAAFSCEVCRVPRAD